MESGVFLPCLEQFMMSPLVTWIKTFMLDDQAVHFDFSALLDGVFLNEIMSQISSSPTTPDELTKVNRIHNLSLLVQLIKSYYQDCLKQLIMAPLPNVLLLCKTPYCEQGLEEMKKLLLLLLGCAVQCENKEDYIDMIQRLDFDTKAAIAAHIQELTQSQENVLDLHWLEVSEGQPEVVARRMALHIRSLLDQRDNYLETITELMQDLEGGRSPQNEPSDQQTSSYSPSREQQQRGTQQHLSVELADSKAKIRRLRQELEEKIEQILDCRHELENMGTDLKRIQVENTQLLVEARAARTYRDELDSMRERAIRADKLESEVGRYRDQLHKMDFYKAKVEELKEDNRVLQETKEVLEEQLEGWRSRSDKIHQLEKQCLLLKAQVHDMEQDKEVDQKRIEDLQEENLALYMAQRRSMEESQHLGWELEQLSKTTENCQGPLSLSEEVNENTHSRMLKLEKENQSLLRTIEELRAAPRNTEPVFHNGSASTTKTHKGLQSSHFYTTNHMKTAATERSSVDANHHKAQLMTMEPIQNKIFFTEEAHFLTQEQGMVVNGVDDVRSEALMSNLEVQENGHNLLHCLVESESVQTSGSKNSSQSHGSIFTGLPTHSSYASKHTQRLEAKCRNLDIFNQHLQTALDNTDRKVQRLEAEVQELETENQTLQATLEELRISTRRLEQLESEKQSLEQENTVLERERRQLEKESRRLRQQTEIQDANLDRNNVTIASLEKETRFLVKELEGLKETAERVKCLERENRELNKQSAIDQRTLANLREELVSEKLKNQQTNNDLERLTQELEMKDVHHREHQDALETSRFKILESELELSLQKSVQIKEEKIEALEARLQESSTINLQLRQELKTVKLSWEALQQRLDEESTLSSSPPKESGKAMSEWLRESQEATKELLKLKDRLIKVERNNATLEAERQAKQAHVKQLDSQCNSQQAQILALQRQATTLQENNTTLQTHNANLQVEKSTLNSQCASLMAQNAQLQQQQTKTESERDTVVREREELRSVHEQLLRDHERLAALHEKQAMDYEALIGKHACLKNAHRTLELETRTLQDRYNTLLQQRARLEELEKTLKEEQVKIAMETDQHKTTVAECGRLRDEKDWLNQTYRQLLNDNELLTADHKEVKSQLNEAKLEHTWLQADFSKLKKEYQELDITSTKLSNQCELLSQLKGNLEEENRHLLNQIETLMLQNRTLLEQTMESKDLFHVEERQYIDKLNDLRRQKEKLEEKIMDQYKFYEPSPPRRRGNWITLKLKKLIKSSSRDSASEHPPSPTHLETDPHLLCHDNSSFVGSDGLSSSPGGRKTSPQYSSNSLKIFPRLKKRIKDKDKAKSIFRRSMSLSSLVHPSPPLTDERWAGSTRLLDRSDTEINADDTLTSSFSTSILSILNRHPTKTETYHPSIHNSETALDVCDLWVTDKVSNDSAVPSGVEDNDELQNQDANHTQSRAQSESSGEFSSSFENQPWSNGSSPVQQPQPQCTSSIQLPINTSTPQRDHLQKYADVTPKERKKDPGSVQDFWLTRGTRSLRRGSKNRFTHCLSDSTAGDKTNQEETETDSKAAPGNTVETRVVACSPITVLYVQGKSSSMSGCLNCFSTPVVKEGRLKATKSTKSLPRANDVVSKAEGSFRRSSVSSDCKLKLDSQPVQVSECKIEDISSPTKQTVVDAHNVDPVPPIKPPRDPIIVPTDRPTSPAQESAFASAFTFNSVFSNTIFSDSVINTTPNMSTPANTQTFMQLTQSLLENGTGQMYVCNTPQTLLSVNSEKDHSIDNSVEPQKRTI